jgi:hypothetical protein
MMRNIKLATVCVMFLLAVSLSASACSGDCFTNVNLAGNSGGTASGSFTFNTSTDTFSNLSVSFNGGLFSGKSAQDSKGGGGCILGICGFSWKSTVGGDTVWNTIILNLKTGQFEDLGGIYNWRNQAGNFNYLAVPEGGNSLTYLLLSGIALFVAIFTSRKRRHAMRAV